VNQDKILCPSSRCESGSILLGIVQNDGHVSFLNKKTMIDEKFVQIAKNGQRNPEKRFRFSNTCVNSSCKQWSNNKCGVIETIIKTMNSLKEPSQLPNCSIRSQCRWYQQCGGKACVVCPEVITDSL
jgi:hypothetical protein